MALVVKRRAVDYAAWRDDRFVGRVKQLPNGWQAWGLDLDGDLVFVGWGRTRAAALDLI
jgi:hypothetical protein